jgi:hypothetical protein
MDGCIRDCDRSDHRNAGKFRFILMKHIAKRNIRGARAPRPLFSAARRKVLPCCEIQSALREAHTLPNSLL